MILQVEKIEAAALLLHMTTMRQSFRNIIKARYRDKKKTYLSSYDYIVGEASKQLESEIDLYTMHLNIQDAEVLRAFLNSYIDKLKKEILAPLKLKDQKTKEELEEQLSILNVIETRCQELVSNV